MSVNHQFDQATLKRLHAFAEPYENPNATVIRLLDKLEQSAELAPFLPGNSESQNSAANPLPHQFFNKEFVDLRHTKVLSANIDGQQLTRPKWNTIMAMLCGKAISRCGLSWMLNRKAPSVTKGKRTDKGYNHLPALDISIQYTDSSKAWSYTYGLAHELGVPVDIQFEWRDKPGAAHPGERGRLVVPIEGGAENSER